jgi:CheY-like chemotaxis protein
MKPKNGWEILTQLKRDQRTAQIPMIVVSIVDQPSMGALLGADEYLVKPVDRATLLAAIERRVKSRLASLTGQQPEAVLLDVQLGNEDGLSLAAWMRQQPGLCSIPVIAVTAHALMTEQQRFLHAGCNACVSKPVNFKLLSEQLDRWRDPRWKLPSVT